MRLLWLCVVSFSLSLPGLGLAQSTDKEALIQELDDYLAFSDYGGGVVFAEQIPAAEYEKISIIDTRDAAQYAQEHIDGAINIEWRQILAERDSIPRDRMVLLYCNTGSLSAQAGFALRVAGWDNVRILQGGFDEWKAKGGVHAHTKALSSQTGAATTH